jgi:AcrR family transcriptional regulator
VSSSGAGTPAPGHRPLRRDAERNRLRILQGARECFAARGLGASLDDIARQSAVGVGTVYRRYPDKQALIDVLFEEHLEDVARVLEEGLAHPDPWTGLTQALEGVIEMQAADRGLMELILGGAHGGASTARARERLMPLGEQLVARAQAQGRLRGDLDHTDLPLLQMMLGSLIHQTRHVAPELWRRYLHIVLDGLRTRRDEPTALRVASPTGEQVEQALHGWRPAR